MEHFDFNKYCLDKLFTDIPEINNVRGKLKEELDWHLEEVGPLAHLIYEDVFRYLVLDLINKEHPTPTEEELIERSFKLIEDLANHEDFEVRCVAEVSFLEPLLASIKPTKRIENYVLPKSLELAREAGKFRYGFNPITWEKEE